MCRERPTPTWQMLNRLIPNTPANETNARPHPQPFSRREKGARIQSPSPLGRGIEGEGIGLLICFNFTAIWYKTKFEITKTVAAWRQILTPAQFAVLRQQGTELPGSSPLNQEHRPGIFSCAGCDCSPPRLNSIVARVGQVFMTRSREPLAQRSTPPSSQLGSKSTVGAAAGIWAMCLKMAPHRSGNAIA
jgi:hypothetical protein